MKHLWILAAALLLTGCDLVDRPDKPVPDDFEATTLDGALLRKKELKGKPWVINFWLPG